VLGVSPDAAAAEIRAAYQARLATQPEGDESPADHEAKLRFAYETLIGAGAAAA
jgi:hypothetical protein